MTRLQTVTSFVVLVLAFGLLARDSFAVTLTMDDLTRQPVNGLVHPAGVTFGFTVGGVVNTAALYNMTGPGTTSYVQDPSIEGPTLGVLSLLFNVPTPVLEFGLARASLTTVPQGARVELFDASNTSLGSAFLDLAPTPTFAEGTYVYFGPAVKRATIDLTTASSILSGERFAFDNLTFTVPEPGVGVLLSSITAILFAARRKSQARV